MRPVTRPTFEVVSVYVQPGPASWKPVMAVETAVVPMLPLMTVFRPWLVMPAEPPNAPMSADEPSTTGGGTPQLMAVKVHVESAAIVLAGTATSLTPVAPPLRFAVYVTPAVRGTAGVNVAIVPVALSSTTEEATTGPGPVTVKTELLMLRGSIRNRDGTLNVALMVS